MDRKTNFKTVQIKEPLNDLYGYIVDIGHSGASESLSVTYDPGQQRRTFRKAVCKGRAKAAAGAKSIATSQGHTVSQPENQTGKQGWGCEANRNAVSEKRAERR
ncbi:MAG: hypothetical protein WC593_13010 [Methanoregula sp.]